MGKRSFGESSNVSVDSFEYAGESTVFVDEVQLGFQDVHVAKSKALNEEGYRPGFPNETYVDEKRENISSAMHLSLRDSSMADSARHLSEFNPTLKASAVARTKRRASSLCLRACT